MIIPDVNLLLYALFEVYREHEAARKWLEGVLARREALRLGWTAILAFLRIGTDARVFRAPLFPGLKWMNPLR